MATTTIDITDTDIIKLVLEFLGSRSFDISLLSLERETGIINGAYSEDALFLRQLIMDGQWDDALDFVKPLTHVEDFDAKRFHYLIIRYKYLELLCLKSEPGPMQQNDFTLEEVVKCLSILEELCHDKKEFSNLCFLLTLPKLSQHEQYRDWNPCSARVQCFSEVYPLIRAFVPPEREETRPSTACENRLVQLLVKGTLYEACVEYCQQKAIGGTVAEVGFSVPALLADAGPCCDADLSLPSWLQSIPHGTFSCPFEQKSLKLRTARLEKPALQAAWSEHILLTPIKPDRFPHCAMPARTRPAEVLSRSLTAQYDGLSYGLTRDDSTMPPSSGRGGGRGRRGTDVKNPLLSASHSGAFRLSNSVIRDRRRDRMSASVERLFASSAELSCRAIASPRHDASVDSNDDVEVSRSGSVPAAGRLHLSSVEPCPAACADSGISSSGGGINSGSGMAPRNSLNSSEQGEARPAAAVESPSAGEGRPATSVVSQSSSTGAGPSAKPEAAGDGLLPNVAVSLVSPAAVSVLPTSAQAAGAAAVGRLQTPSASSSGTKLRESVGELYSEYQRQKQRISEQMEQHERLRESMWQQLQETEDSSGGSRTAVAAAAIAAGQQQEQQQHVQLRNKTSANDIMGGSYGSSRGSSGIMYDSMIDGDSSSVLQQQQLLPSVATASAPLPPSSVGQPLNEIYEEPEHIDSSEDDLNRFVSVCSVEDTQAIRAAAFHPKGSYFAVGANSKVLRVCRFPDITGVDRRHQTVQAEIVGKHSKLHKGSIYCLAWSSDGRLIASGSNDHRVKVLSFDPTHQHTLGDGMELTMHDGTVRDLTFLSDRTLVSGGAGSNQAYVVDCTTGAVVRALAGHTAPILAVHCWSSPGSLFVTGSQDKTARVWDIRAAASILHFVPPANVDSAFASVCVETSGRVMASGHEDSSCLLFDIRGGRLLQQWRPHDDEVRCVQFSPSGLYLLTSSYDGRVRLADVQGDLTAPLPTVDVARHIDKVIQCRWHPQLLAFVTTSADKTATCWAIPVG